jgi:hypothetical protein
VSLQVGQTNGTISVGVVGSYRISNDYSGRGGGSSSTHIKHFLISSSL